MAKIVGTGAVRVFPVMTGFKKTVKNEMAGSGREGAKGFADSLKGAGTKAGKQLGKELGTTAKDAMKNVGGDQVKQLSKDVASASAAVSKARIKQQTTTAAAIQAENAYANAVKQHGADSAQAAAASQRLAAARERVKLADVELAAATGNLKSAQETLSTVQKDAETQAKALAIANQSMFARFKMGFRDLDAGKDNATGLAGAFGSLAGAISGPITSGLSKFRAGWVNADMAMLDGAGVMGRIGGAVHKLTGTITGTVGKWGGMIAAPFKNGAAIAKQLGTDFSYGLNQRFAPAKAAIGKFASTIATPFKAVGGAIGGYLAPVGSAVGNVFDKIAPMASSAANGIKGAFRAVGTDIKAKLSSVGDSVKGLATLSVGGLAAGVGALGTALIGVGKSAVGAYASYEQAVGGIDTLFKDSSKTVQAYAADAYKNAGVSANDYMAQITSFSASLISSLGGDTSKAAELGNTAMVDMSDNANKMGTDLGSIQQTYQSLARGNYQMLDNLKLGYGGTKTEMERLILDANKLREANGQAGDLSIDKFSDVVQAIHEVQNNLGITGTTAKEASTTIEGSVGSMKAAWQNWLTELGKNDADMGKLTNQLVTSIGTVIKNIGPRIGVIVKSLIASLPSMLGEITKILPEPIQQAIGKITGLASQFKTVLAPIGAAFLALGAGGIAPLLSKIPLLGGLLGGLSGPLAMLGGPLGILTAGLGALIATSPQLQSVFRATLNPLLEQFKTILDGLKPTFDQMVTAIGGMIQQIMPAVTGFVAALIPVIGQVIATLMPIIPTVLTPIMDAVTQMAPVVGGIITTIIGFIQTTLLPAVQATLPYITGVINSIGTVVQGLVNIISGVINMIAGILNGNWTQVWEGFKQVVSGAVQALGGIVSGIKDIILGALAGAGTWLLNAGKAIIQGLIDGIMSMIDAAGDAIGWVMDKISSFIPHSPAKRGPFSGRGWTTYSGQAIVEGLAQGVTDNAGKAEQAIQAAMQRAQAAADGVELAYRSVKPATVTNPTGTTPNTAGQRTREGNTVNVSIDAHGMNSADIFNEFDLRTKAAASGWGGE